MKKAKVDVLVAMFAYAGNGGVAAVLPEIATWLATNTALMAKDERVGRVAVKRYGDIPLTMERNRVVKDAKDGGFDIIIMIDSDNIPDLYLGSEPEAKPFWGSSFDFIYDRMMVQGIPTVVCAPYCGPPPHPVRGGEENVYVFYASGNETDEADPIRVNGVQFEAYSREHAAIMRGIQPCAAGPTGCIIYTTDAFDLMPIHGESDEEILLKYKSGEITLERAKTYLSMESWFFYEFTDRFQTNKASTEDVTNTREIQFAGVEKYREEVVFCNWDAWAAHMKPKCVGKPRPIKLEHVSEVFAEAVRNNISTGESLVDVDFTDDLDEPSPSTWEGEESVPSLHARLSEPKGKKGIRLGQLFESPLMSPVDCESVRNILELLKARRCVVIGDEAGEMSHAAKWNKDCDVFAIHTGPKWGQYGGLEGVKMVGIDERPDVMEMAQDLEPQEVDAVVFNGALGPEAAKEWMEKHVRPGGSLILMDPTNVLAHSLDLDSTYECRMLENTHVQVIRKQNVTAAV